MEKEKHYLRPLTSMPQYHFERSLKKELVDVSLYKLETVINTFLNDLKPTNPEVPQRFLAHKPIFQHTCPLLETQTTQSTSWQFKFNRPWKWSWTPKFINGFNKTWSSWNSNTTYLFSMRIFYHSCITKPLIMNTIHVLGPEINWIAFLASPNKTIKTRLL